MRRHIQSWGAAYILAAFFLGSLWGQYLTGWDVFVQEQSSHGEIATRADYLPHFWQATFENWQSEWFQLWVQAVLILGLGHYVFKADKADMEDVQDKLDYLCSRMGAAQAAQNYTITYAPAGDTGADERPADPS